MAKVKGIVEFVGTVGNLNFYNKKGVAMVRQSGGGFNGEAIKTKASMVRVRENGSEFGGVSRFKKMLRLSLHDALLHSHDGTLHGRMMTLLQGVKVFDGLSERGKRSVWNGLATADGGDLLRAFMFTPKQGVVTLFSGLPQVGDLGADCSFTGLRFNEGIFVKSATHLKLDYFVIDYDPEFMTFKRYSCDKLVVANGDLPGVIPTFEVAGLPPTFSYRMVFLGVQFFQSSNGVLVALKEQGMCGVRCLGGIGFKV